MFYYICKWSFKVIRVIIFIELVDDKKGEKFHELGSNAEYLITVI